MRLSPVLPLEFCSALIFGYGVGCCLVDVCRCSFHLITVWPFPHIVVPGMLTVTKWYKVCQCLMITEVYTHSSWLSRGLLCWIWSLFLHVLTWRTWAVTFKLSILSFTKDSLPQIFPWGSSWKFYLIYYDMMLDVVNIDLLTLLTFVQRSCCERESTPRLVCAKTNCCNHAISVTSLQPCTNMQRVVVLSIFREARRQKIAQFPSFRPWYCWNNRLIQKCSKPGCIFPKCSIQWTTLYTS